MHVYLEVISIVISEIPDCDEIEATFLLNTYFV